ncbi:DNA/RNA non-specific endonuclease [Croceivirga sp. JEA036]|uniref:DNA/RNA non-specific endonuclease n=1 Tax=Croceivirga sp. JEA036 TaxID=2721162 RepID=UPI001439E08C|nr:DNA/RNA non-specific endonuclease [Croceivirga sp. JEA036]NJB36673.1 DNA/RNA non-specific endonuclease [Croceivirga sp. JEA036]
MKKKTTYSLILIALTVGFWLFQNFYTPAAYSNPAQQSQHSPFLEQLQPSSTYGATVEHDHYMLSYSEAHEQAEWVAYELKREHLTYDDRKRPYFIEDPKVKSKSADWRNYRGSGYDRGHLVPAGDRKFTEYAYNETFYTSNISPQNRAFNAGVWNELEKQVRRWCKKYGDLYIITAGVLEDGLKEIGDEDVDVPNSYYKIVIRPKGDDYTVLAFLMPNRPTTASFMDFVVPVDVVEKATGIDFFPKLQDNLENQLESKTYQSDWEF